MKENTGEFSLKDLWDFMVAKLWVIVICAIVGGMCGYFYANSHKVTTYSVSTSLFVQSISADGTTSNVSVSKQRVPLYMEIISSNRDFHEEVLTNLTAAERAKYGFSKDDTGNLASLRKMASMIRTEQSGDLEMFYVHVTAATEECAMKISEIIEKISTEEDEKKNAVYKNIGAPSHIKCVDKPRANGASTSGNSKTTLLVGAFGGALLSVCALWLYLAFDNRVRTRKSLETHFDLPILGVIPRISADFAFNEAAAASARRNENE